MGRVRANEIRFYDLGGTLLYESPPSSYKKGRWAPSWFSDLVDPKLSEYRLNLPIGYILITPDSSRSILDSWDEIRKFALLAIIFYFLLNILVFWLLGRWLRPIGGIVGGLSKMQKGDFTVRLSSYSVPELSAISRTFNSVAQALQDSLGQKQRLALIAEQSSDAIIIHDLEGKISFLRNSLNSIVFLFEFKILLLLGYSPSFSISISGLGLMLPEATSYPLVSITTFPSLSKINIDKFLISSLDKIASYII